MRTQQILDLFFEGAPIVQVAAQAFPTYLPADANLVVEHIIRAYIVGLSHGRAPEPDE